MTFRKGHTLLGIVGIILPILWLIGAFMPAKEGSRYDIEQQTFYQAASRGIHAIVARNPCGVPVTEGWPESLEPIADVRRATME